MKECEYSSLCRKMEMAEQPTVSYWPRDPAIRSYCMGEEDPHNCMASHFWQDNPKLRGSVKIVSRPGSMIVPASLCIAASQTIIWMPSGNDTLGVLGSAFGAYCLASGLSRRYRGKGFLKWLLTRKEREGTGEIYDKIIKTAENLGETDSDTKDLDYGIRNNIDAAKFSVVENMTPIFSKASNAKWRGTGFRTFKVGISYPLTEDSSIIREKDLGVMLVYEYDKRFCNDPKCEEHKMKNHYITGVLAPKINRKRVTKGIGFIECMRHKTIPLPPIPIQMMDQKGVMVAAGTAVAAEPVGRDGIIDKIFGSQREFDSLARECMDEKTIINARNLHNLMQEILYSDF